jgi:serine/threonine protein kinase
MRSLKGASVPRVYWTGVYGEFHVLVMDRLGKSLQQLCDARPVRMLSVNETRALGIKCVELLRGIHEAGVVHGDVKP